ncbi:MAG: type VI secretion system tip protein VgrG, partial [Acidobacteria bacterium]|nr:type VI secretion system tip protein VgrG [Acidobacteriota bacterium]
MPAAEQYQTTPRFLYLKTPLGADKLLLKTFSGYEAMSELYRYQLEVQAKNDVDVQFDKLIGQDIVFGLNASPDAANKPARPFSGLCIEVSQGTRGTELTEYSLVVVPRVWTLTQQSRSRIFQQKTIPDILRAVLEGVDVEYQIDGTYKEREYCVQYRESDFDFASRLMEEEGIYYYFKFTPGAQKLIVTDKERLTTDVNDFPTIKFDPMGGGGEDPDEEMRISHFRRSQTWRSGKITLWDHHFQLPHRHLEADKQVLETVSAGTVTHKLKLNGNDAFEIYDYPGDYGRFYDGINKGGGEQASKLDDVFTANRRIAQIRMQQEE